MPIIFSLSFIVDHILHHFYENIEKDKEIIINLKKFCFNFRICILVYLHSWPTSQEYWVRDNVYFFSIFLCKKSPSDQLRVMQLTATPCCWYQVIKYLRVSICLHFERWLYDCNYVVIVSFGDLESSILCNGEILYFTSRWLSEIAGIYVGEHCHLVKLWIKVLIVYILRTFPFKDWNSAAQFILCSN